MGKKVFFVGRSEGGVINAFADLGRQFWGDKRATVQDTNAIEDKVYRVMVEIERGETAVDVINSNFTVLKERG